MGDWRDFYRSIPLTDEEREEAILQGQIKKHFYEKNRPYWQEKEGLAPGKVISPTNETVSHVVEERSPEAGDKTH